MRIGGICGTCGRARRPEWLAVCWHYHCPECFGPMSPREMWESQPPLGLREYHRREYGYPGGGLASLP